MLETTQSKRWPINWRCNMAWKYQTGRYGHRVRVFERHDRGGMIHAEVSGEKRRSLGHRDRVRAKAWADEMSHKLALGQVVERDAIPRVDYALSEYLTHRSPRHTPSEQQRDQRCAELWTRVLGPATDLTEISLETWEDFAADRLAGRINARGQRMKKPQPVRARTVASDQQWLRQTILWAMKRKIGSGKRLMTENPLTVEGFSIMQVKNPRRPIATTTRYEQTRAASDHVLMDIRANGQRWQVRSYLSEILDIVHGTGRRLSSILWLRVNDFDPEMGPHGALDWRAERDKMRKAWNNIPIGVSVRAALDRILAERPAIGDALLVPSPRNPRTAISKDLASHWLERAEQMAGLPKLDGSLWHAYRRGWATARKHLPDADLQASGGWKDLTSLKTAYQQPDAVTLYEVVSAAKEIREDVG